MRETDKVKSILADRQNTYGDADANFARTGRMWGALLFTDDIPAWQVALMLDAYKSIRCVANPLHEDSWLDKLGYTTHGQKIAITDES